MTAQKSVSDSSSTEPARSTPALLTRTSIGPWSFCIAAMARVTDSSESTSMVETAIGSFSRAAVSARAGDRVGLRMVAWTLCPARPKASAASKPIPLLVPVISTDAICVSLGAFPSADSTAGGKRKTCTDLVSLADDFPGSPPAIAQLLTLHLSINRTDTWFNRAVSANGPPGQPHRLPPLQLQAQGAANQRIHGKQSKFPKPRAFGPPPAIQMGVSMRTKEKN